MGMRNIVLLCLFSLLLSAPVLGVSRLFVDEITGYTNENVTAKDVRTGILIVEEFTNVEPVRVTGGDSSQTVDTPGTIRLAGGQLLVNATGASEITSLGENIVFRGAQVNFNAANNLSIDSVDSSIDAGSATSNIGGTFSTFGTDAEIRSIFDMTYNSGDDFFLSGASRVQMSSDTVRFNSLDSLTMRSAQSNIFIESLQSIRLDADNTLYYQAESGMQLTASHGRTRLEVDDDLVVRGENFIYTSDSGLFEVSGDLTMSATAVNGDVVIDTERARFRNNNGPITITSTELGSVTSVLSRGSIESMSDELQVSGNTVLLFSADSSVLSSRTDTNYRSQQRLNFLASVGLEYAGNVVNVESFNGDFFVRTGGKANFDALYGDIIASTAQDTLIKSGNSYTRATDEIQLNSGDLDVNGDYVHFFSFTDILATMNSLNVVANRTTLDSHEGTIINTEDTTLNARGFFTAASSGDLYFRGSDSFSNQADNIDYLSSRESLISVNSFDANANDIRFTAGGQLEMVSASAVAFNAATSVASESERLLITADEDVLINAQEAISLAGSIAGGFDLESATVSLTADDWNVASRGQVVFTTGSILSNTDALEVNARDVVFSSVQAFRASGAGTLTFTAPTVYTFLPTALGAANTTITGSSGVVLSAGATRGDVVRVTADDFTSTANQVNLQGGYIRVNADDINLGTPGAQQQDVEFSSANEKDITTIAGTIDVRAGRNMVIGRSNVRFDAATTLTTDFDRLAIYAKERAAIVAKNTVDLAVTDDFIALGFDEIVFNSEGDLAINAAIGDIYAEKLSELLADDNLRLDSATDLNSISRNLHIRADQWNSDSTGDASILAGDSFEGYFQEIFWNASDFNVLADSLQTSSVAETLFQATSDVNTVSNNLNVLGFKIIITAEDSTLVNADTGDVTIGSSKSTPANANLENVNIDLGSDYTVLGENMVSMIATGAESFERLALDFAAQSITFVANNGDLNVLADNGFRVFAPISSSTSGDATTITAGEAIRVDEFENGDINFNSEQSTVFNAVEARVVYSALGDIYQLSGDMSLTAGKTISVETLKREDATDASVDFEAQVDMTWTGSKFAMAAGVDNDDIVRDSSITYNVGADATFQYGDKVEIRAYNNNQNRLRDSPAAAFQGAYSGLDSEYTIQAAKQMGFYPSGDYFMNTATDVTFTAGRNSNITLGSASDGFTYTAGVDITYTSARDYTAHAGGVNGDLTSTAGGDQVFTVTGAILGSANDTMFVQATQIVATATQQMYWNTRNDKSVIDTLSAADLDYITTNGLPDSDITINGKNTRARSANLNIFSPVINIGEENQVTPRISSKTSSFTVTSIGDLLIDAENDMVRHIVDDLFTTEAKLVRIQSGGDAFFQNDGVVGDGAININAGTLLDMTAADYFEVDIGDFGGVVDHDGNVFLSSAGTSSGDGFYIDIANKVQFASDVIFEQKILDSYTLRTANGLLTTVDFTSTSKSLNFNVDEALGFKAGNSVLVSTTGATAKIEIGAEGVNGDIEFGGNSLDVNSAEDLFITARTLQAQYGNLVASATGENSGKMTMQASDTVSFVAADIVLNTFGNFDLESIDEGSLTEFNGNSYAATSSQGTISFATDADEGGSIIVRSESQNTNFAMRAEDWNLDIDGSFNVNTTGNFNFVAGGNFEIASADGYADVYASNVFFTSTDNRADIVFTAENADVRFESTEGLTRLQAGGNIVSNTQRIDYVVRGNDTSATQEYLQIIGSSVDFGANGGSQSHTAYNSYEVTTDAFVRFDAASNQGVDGITITTTYPAADFVADVENAFVYGLNGVTMIATGTGDDSGFINIEADDPTVFNPAWYGQPGFEFPSVTFTSGSETLVQTLEGDIITEFSSNLLITGGDINGVAGESIEFHVRGDGRTIVPFVDDAGLRYDGAINFDSLSGVQFISEIGGDVIVEAAAADITFDTLTTTIRSGVEDLYLESTGTVSFLSYRPQAFTGVDFDSTGYITATAYDDDILFRGGDLFLAATLASATESTTLQTEHNSELRIVADGAASYSSVSDMLVTNAYNAPVRFHAHTDITFNGANLAATFTAGRDLFFEYRRNLRMTANGIRINAGQRFNGEMDTITDESGVIFIEGSATRATLDDESVHPRVVFPSRLFFNAGRTPATQGSYCEYNRAIAWGSSNQGGRPDDLFCACVDHVWLCRYSDAANTGQYYYENRPDDENMAGTLNFNLGVGAAPPGRQQRI